MKDPKLQRAVKMQQKVVRQTVQGISWRSCIRLVVDTLIKIDPVRKSYPFAIYRSTLDALGLSLPSTYFLEEVPKCGFEITDVPKDILAKWIKEKDNPQKEFYASAERTNITFNQALTYLIG